MTERVVEACNDLHSSGRSGDRRLATSARSSALTAVEARRNRRLLGGLADLPLLVSELQIEAPLRAGPTGRRPMNDRHVGLRVGCRDDDLNSMLATTGYCLAVATREWMSYHCLS